LVHKARNTAFGMEHDFHRIRTEEDYRRLVPVTTNAELFRSYWQPHVTALGGTTWLNPVTGLATYDAGEKTSRQVLLSADLFRSQRRAIRTALALVLHGHRFAQLLSGAMLFLGGPVSVAASAKGQSAMRPEAAILRGVPGECRPFCLAAPDTALDALAEKCVAAPLTLVSGSVTEILRLAERAKAVAGRDRITDVWPDLTAVLYSASPSERHRAHELRGEVGPGVGVLEMARFPEGAVAVEDPRYGLLRLLVDSGVYCEFIPAEECAERTPARVGLSQVRAGAVYELVLTSPAGVWSCRAAAAVCFERLDPPLFRLVEMPRPEAASEKRGPLTITRQDSADAPKAPAPHRQSAGTPAVPPKSFGHSPWLIHADRG
jgi:hypothetical protein